MSFEISGKLLEIFPGNQVTDKFKKRDFVIQKESNGFSDEIKFQLTQDRCAIIDAFKKGEEIKVYFNIKGRKWEKDGRVNYFTNLEAWKIERLAQDMPADEVPPPDINSAPPEEEMDDLPF